jgi:hypothetical protein
MQGATRDFALIGESSNDFEPHGVAQGVEDMSETNVL